MSVNVVNKSTGALTKVAGNAITEASGINYSHTTSGMSATNVQDAIDESYSELKSSLTDLTDHVDGDATTYPYADVITINDAVPANLADCSVKVEPVQDLHGYDKPWVGGAGINKLPLTLDSVKASNTSGTWSGNIYTYQGVTFTVNTDDDENITSILVNGTSTAASTLSSNFRIDVRLNTNTQYILSGCPSGGSYNTYRYGIWDSNWGNEYNDYGSGVTFNYSASGVSKTNIIITGGTTANNLVFYPMIRLSTETDATFAPYTNICPISGHTEAVVTRDGKNWFNKNAVGIAVGKYLNSETGELVNSTNNWNTSEYIYVGGLGGESITFSGLNSIGASNFSVCYYDKNNSFVSGTNGKVMTLTIPSDERIAYLRFDYRQVDVDDVQLELGSIATPYEPYKGQQYTIALGDTIYGGTVDFKTGVMTVTHGFAEFNDTTGISLYHQYDGTTYNHAVFLIRLSYMRLSSAWDTDGLSSNIAEVKVIADADEYNNFTIRRKNNTRELFLFAPTYMGEVSLTDLANILNNTPMQICYDLETPTTVQLTPEQIQLLQGTNTLYASTGDISVTVNGVSGAIGQVQTQANATDNALAQLAADIAEQLPDAPATDGTYVLTVTVADGAATYSWESAE